MRKSEAMPSTASPPPPCVLAVVGLQAEARIAQDPRVKTVCGGGQAALLKARLAEALAAGGVAGLASFGIAGGLDAGLRPGTAVLARWVAGAGGRWTADAAWLAALTARCPGMVAAGIVGSDHAIGTPQARQGLQASTGAAAVDMESHVVAEMAQAHGLPFVAIRVVADAAERTLPAAALIPLRPDGRPDIGRILAAVAADPGQIPALIRVARETGKAFASLRRVRRQLGLGLACPDLLKLVLDMP
ncbi:phosphorylase family protein [Labrys monachus]|uniref:Hopanoid-associated phosphorylase n=1 Tax=Labrys monachus TaxID=217067 RepID=A0ABU0FBG2_9HYPH|nr:phosphorylase [Labrys monachus]MDQ0391963.1 hopanoid-associated phosphorylase [Labrys monachus]